MNNEKNVVKVVELFAGVGGFRLGFEKTSSIFKTIWANQWEPGKKSQWAFDCYQKHFGINLNHVNKDISTVIDEIPKHDLLVGGFPCQDYSVARTNARGIEGKKGVLWWSIKNIISKNKPKFILLENVDRLIKSPTNQRGRDFGIMLRSLYDEGYNVEWRIINAADYGFLQRRRRVFVFAYLKNLKSTFDKIDQVEIIKSKGFFSKSFPIEKNEENHEITKTNIKNFVDIVDVSDNFSATFFNSGSMINGEIISFKTVPIVVKQKKLLDILEKEKVNEKYFVTVSLEKFKYLKGNKKIPRIKPNGEPYIYSEGSMDFPDSVLKPARTMLTSEGSVNRSTHVISDIKTNKLRLLTPLECERINGFDDEWTNTGMPERFRYFCMGNALVVPIIQIMAKEFVALWNEITNN